VDLAGAEVTSFELCEVFAKLGYEVSIASFELGETFESVIKKNNLNFFNLSNTDSFKKNTHFDLVWLHHITTASRVLLDKNVSIKYAIYSSLSFFEGIESPPFSFFSMSMYLVNSVENYNKFVDNYPEFKSKVRVLHNSAPKIFWKNVKVSHSKNITRLGIISNHIPIEISDLLAILKNNAIEYDVIGLSGNPRIVTPELLHSYDAIITIGKTVQYCIACEVPVYCYDHFGGYGWITSKSFDLAREYNFSGRGGQGKLDCAAIYNDLLNGYPSAIKNLNNLANIGRQYFDLEKNIKDIVLSESDGFSLNLNSTTNINIFSRFNQAYLSLRNMVNNLENSLLTKSSSYKLLSDQSSERDTKIQELNHVASEREKKIQELNHVASEREKKIQELNHVASERETKIQELNHVASERETKIQELVIEASIIKTSKFFILIKISLMLDNKLQELISACKVFLNKLNQLFKRSIYVYTEYGLLEFFKRFENFFKRQFLIKKTQFNLKKNINIDFQNQEILITFIMPVYDRTDILRDAINSLLNQTIKQIELIIVTDGSPEETISVCNEFLANPRVKIFNYPVSSGNAVRGRNKAILEASGKYIGFLDSDDIASESRAEKSIIFLEKNTDVVYGSWQAIVDGSRLVENIHDGQIVSSPDADLDTLIKISVPCQSSVMLKKSLFKRSGYLKPAMKYREDHELWARLAFFGARFKSLPDILVKLRLHSNNNEINFKDNDNYWLEKVKSEFKIQGPFPKKIAFILPGVSISGGVGVVFKHAELLINAGHDAYVINVGIEGDGNWFTNNIVPIYHISDNRAYINNNIDLLFATGWQTVEWLPQINAKRKLYFVQSDERRFTENTHEKQIIHNTYLTSCEYLTEALWIKKMLKNEFGHIASYVPNGIDLNVFYPAKPIKPKTKKIRVLIEGPICIPFKGMEDSYSAIKGLDCELWIVSSAGKPPKDWEYDSFFEGISFGDMKYIYSSCDIFLKMSRIEGFFGPPMEAMACGCAVIVGKVTGYNEYIKHNFNALVVSQGDTKSARSALIKLIKNKKIREKIVSGGYQTVKKWGWERSSKAMLSLVNKNNLDKST
jgi:glycosyltransferase involved in cell wall biosynthesis